MCTLFLHHFKNEELISILKTTTEKATIGVVVNDLHRHKLAYYLFKLIGYFIKNKMVRQDGLTSILRAFKRKERDQKECTSCHQSCTKGIYEHDGNHSC